MVAGDESSWSAVSSTVRPPKKRSSTIRASSGLCGLEAGERLVERLDLDRAHAARQHALVQRHLVRGPAALGGTVCARAFHQDLAHGVGGDRP